jgi:hypothetical protein
MELVLIISAIILVLLLLLFGFTFYKLVVLNKNLGHQKFLINNNDSSIKKTEFYREYFYQLNKYSTFSFFTFLFLAFIFFFIYQLADDKKGKTSMINEVKIDSLSYKVIKNYIELNTSKMSIGSEKQNVFLDSIHLLNFQKKLEDNTNQLEGIKNILNTHTAKKSSMLSLIIPFGIFLIAGLLTFLLYKRNYKRMALVTATLAFPINEVIGKLIDGEIKLWPEPTINVTNNYVDNSLKNDSAFYLKTDTFNFGPFVSGMNYVEKNILSEKMEKLKFDLTQKKYKEILLSGGVDVREPINKSKEMYGDNLSLSQARSIFVKELIKNMIVIDENNIIPLAGGAFDIRIKYDSIDHEQNRMVHIFAKY